MKKLVIYCSLGLFTAIAPDALAARVITGVVTSVEDKEPLTGASVLVTPQQLKAVGSKQGAVGVLTNIDGEFSITVPDGVTEIECRYVGYTPKIIKLVGDKSHYV